MSVLLGKSARRVEGSAVPTRQPKYNLPQSRHDKTARKPVTFLSSPEKQKPRRKPTIKQEKKVYKPKKVTPHVLDLSGLPCLLSSVKEECQNAMEMEVLQTRSALIELQIQEHRLELSRHAKYWMQLDPTNYMEEMRALGEEEKLQSMGLWPQQLSPSDISTLLGHLQLLQQNKPLQSQSQLISV
jgi:hypothetical protein